MRACVQCGLSIGDTATFCQVCGTPAEPAATAPAVEPAVTAPATEPAGVEDPPEDGSPHRPADVSCLLRDASSCEATDAAGAADLYRAAIFVCLEAGEDPLGSEDVCRDLLCGFDCLSGVLEREGIAEEALDVVDSAASLGLLDGRHAADQEHLDALKDRRERLRRALHGDSAQL